MEVLAILISVATVLCLLLQIHLQRKTMVADHERRKKQATIEYVNSVKVKYRPIAEKLNRSEEHTSELQSLTNLVCRLLLEKKNNNNNNNVSG